MQLTSSSDTGRVFSNCVTAERKVGVLEIDLAHVIINFWEIFEMKAFHFEILVGYEHIQALQVYLLFSCLLGTTCF